MMRAALLACLLSGASLGAFAQETSVDPETPAGEMAGDALASEQDMTGAEGEAADAGEDDVTEERMPVWLQRQTATLRGLDKITGRSTDFDVVVGEIYNFGSLEIDMKVCYQKPPEEPPESAAFLQIVSTRPMESELAPVDDETPLIFSGWMFASSPGLNALEHSVYDVWVIECTGTASARQD